MVLFLGSLFCSIDLCVSRSLLRIFKKYLSCVYLNSEHMYYNYNDYFCVFVWTQNIWFSSGSVYLDWSFFSLRVRFSYFFVCLVIFDWMPDIVNFTILNAGYFYIPINIEKKFFKELSELLLLLSFIKNMSYSFFPLRRKKGTSFIKSNKQW